jgi:hypothetical protein
MPYFRIFNKSILNRFTFVVIASLFFSNNILAQAFETYPDSINKKRLNTVVYTSSGLYTATLGVLYLAWYKDSDLTNFHFYNDNSNWLQVDKAGHATTAYVFSNYAYWWLRWAGVDNNRSAVFGGLMGWTSMTVIEILDGFSSEYGASPGDLLANTVGASLFTGQQLLWKEQRLRMKFSYHPTGFAQYRPDLLGNSPLQRIIKDYNGQTIWLSLNIKSFLRKESKFPEWLNIALGYGATGMLGASSNPPEYDGNPLPYYDRCRQYYLSLDVDWTKIKTNSKVLRFIFKGLNFVKAPMPTLEITQNKGADFYWLYF